MKQELLRLKQKLQTGKQEIENGKKQIEQAKAELTNQEKKLSQTKSTTNAKLEDAKSKIETSKQEIETGEQELNQKKQEFEEKISEAEEKLIDAKQKISDIENPKWYVLDRYGNAGYNGFIQDTQSISNIGKAFPVVFFVVAALISLTSMTRMVEEQRTRNRNIKSIRIQQIANSKQIHYLCQLSVCDR